jgi:hypothetical protein
VDVSHSHQQGHHAGDLDAALFASAVYFIEEMKGLTDHAMPNWWQVAATNRVTTSSVSWMTDPH